MEYEEEGEKEEEEEEELLKYMEEENYENDGAVVALKDWSQIVSPTEPVIGIVVGTTYSAVFVCEKRVSDEKKGRSILLLTVMATEQHLATFHSLQKKY